MRAALFLAGLFLAGSVWADIGSVTESSGVAVIKRGNNTVTIVKGTVVEMNDRIETKNGRVKVVFKDATAVTVTESSALVIDDFVYDPASGDGKLGLKAAAGTVRYVSGAIARNPKNVKINTPTAAITVRGTDFVMAVGETGSSMIMLMPTCEIEGNINLRGLTCGSGAIDVETPAGIVQLNRPYQATLVETINGVPSEPVIVALNGMAIGNNLLIAPPNTSTGLNVIAAARTAAVRTGDASREDTKDTVSEEQNVAAKSDAPANRARNRRSTSGDDEEEKTTTNANSVEPATSINKDAVINEVATVGETENPYVKRLWKDKSETQQIGWMYESLSPNNRNYTNVVMPLDTQALVVVTQDMQTNSWNFSPGKSIGQIVINQTYR